MSDSDPHESDATLYRHLGSSDRETLMRDYPCLEECRKIARELLPYTVVNNTGFTKHDYLHSVRVIEYSDRILDMLHDDEMLDHDECAVLYMAAWLHDVGMMFCSRGDESIGDYTHGEISSLFISTYMRKQDGFGHLDEETSDLLGCVIRSHNMSCSSHHGEG